MGYKLKKETINKNKLRFEERLKKEKNGDFELIGEYKTMRTKTKIRHKVCGYEWYTIPHTLMLSKKGLGCPNCQYREKSKTTEEYIKELECKSNGQYKLIEGQKYKHNREKLKFKHVTCGTEFYILPSSILRDQESCPECQKNRPSPKKRTNEKFKKELFENKGESYELVSEYDHALAKVKVKHTKCNHEWWVRPYHILHDNGCPYCYGSRGELLVQETLEDNNIEFKKEYTFEDCVYINKLRFDFAVFKENTLLCCLEYDGIQHYEPIEYFGGLENFKKQQIRDNIKKEYCLNNNIPLLKIPYSISDKKVKEEVLNFIENCKAENP